MGCENHCGVGWGGGAVLGARVSRLMQPRGLNRRFILQEMILDLCALYFLSCLLAFVSINANATFGKSLWLADNPVVI